jgi:hypothetical protein
VNMTAAVTIVLSKDSGSQRAFFLVCYNSFGCAQPLRNACVMMSWIGFLVKGKYKVSGFQT